MVRLSVGRSFVGREAPSTRLVKVGLRDGRASEKEEQRKGTSKAQDEEKKGRTQAGRQEDSLQTGKGGRKESGRGERLKGREGKG